MKLLIKKNNNKKETLPVSYIDLPLEYLRNEYPEIYNAIIKKYKAVDSYLYIRSI